MESFFKVVAFGCYSERSGIKQNKLICDLLFKISICMVYGVVWYIASANTAFPVFKRICTYTGMLKICINQKE